MNEHLYKSQKIESEQHFTEWCNLVNSPSHSIPMCDLQDIFARSDVKYLKHLFVTITKNERSMAVFCIQKAMGADVLFDFVSHYARSKFVELCETEMAEIDARHDKIIKREAECSRQINEMAGKVKKQADRITDLEIRNENCRAELNKCYNKSRELNETIEAQAATIKKLTAFESHVKELLSAWN